MEHFPNDNNTRNTEMSNENCNKNWITQTPFPMMATDESGQVSWVNPAFEDLCAVEVEEIIGATADDPPSAASLT